LKKEALLLLWWHHDLGWWNARWRGLLRIAGSKTECLQNPVKEEIFLEVAIRGEIFYYPSAYFAVNVFSETGNQSFRNWLKYWGLVNIFLITILC
jgi:hypothetical protein